MKIIVLILLSVGALVALLLTGCASSRFDQVRVDVDGVRTETHQRTRTFFDAKSEASKIHATTTDKTQSPSIGSVNAESSGSNVAHLVIDVVGAAAAKAP